MGVFDAVVDVEQSTDRDESGTPNSGSLYPLPGPFDDRGIDGVQTPLPQTCTVIEALSTVMVPHWPLRGPPLTQYCPVSVG